MLGLGKHQPPSATADTTNPAYGVTEKSPPDGAVATRNPTYGVVENNPVYDHID